MKGIAKRRFATSAIAAISAIALVAGLMIPQPLAFADNDDATQDAAQAQTTQDENSATAGSESNINVLSNVNNTAANDDADASGGTLEGTNNGTSRDGTDSDPSLDAVTNSASKDTSAADPEPDSNEGAAATKNDYNFIDDSTKPLTSFGATVDGSSDVSFDVYDSFVNVDLSVNEGAAYTVSCTSSDSSVAEGYWSTWDPSFAQIGALGAGTATITFTATDVTDHSKTLSSSIKVTITNNIIPNYPNPYDKNGNLLPHTIKDGVMTFPGGDPKLDEWYRLDVELNEGVVSQGYIGGSRPWATTILPYALDPADPGYNSDANSYLTGPYYVRGNNAGGATLSFIQTDTNKVLDLKLEPASAGTITHPMPNCWTIQLNAPATLKVAEADSTNVVISNDSGASLTVTVDNPEDENTWGTMDLVTDQLEGEAADSTISAVETINGAALNTAAFDIYLLNRYNNDVAEIPEGTSVTVTLPIPEDWNIGNVKLFHVADDGTVTDMNATVDVQARTLSFVTTHFSTFVMANYAAPLTNAEQGTAASADGSVNGLATTGDSMAGFAGLVAVAIAAVCVGIIAFHKSRNQR